MIRRNFLKIAGTSSFIIAAGIGGFVLTRSPRKALAPWDVDASLYPDPMRRALSFAILAPNPHNRQPWVVDLKSDTEAVLTCDLDRLLPATDPFSRQIVIGLGCFLELFTLAAADGGYRAEISLFPQGEDQTRLDARPIANLKLVGDSQAQKSDLFQHALSRHTNRNGYDMTLAINQEILKQIETSANPGVIAGTVGGGEALEELRALTRDAMRDEIMNPAAFQESIDLMRIGKSEIETNPDGISLGGPFLETLSIAGILTREELANPASKSFQIGLEMADESAMSAMGFVWISTNGNTRRDQVIAGQSYMRVALEVTRQGLAMQPMSQALQEYADMQPYYQRAHEMLTDNSDERIQMLARLGYADSVDPAPRWALPTRIKNV